MALTSSRILVVEDDSVTRLRHQGYFQQAGYEVTAVSSGAEMRAVMAEREFDLVLLDVNLPDEDGLQLTRELRGDSTVGIILVTGRSDAVDKIVGLEMGADDYVTKPVEMRELLVRVKNLLWRIHLAQQPASSAGAGTELHFAGWTLNLGNRRLCRGEQEVRLTTAEFELLAAFARYPQQVLARERLLSLVSHRVDAPDDRTIDVLVRRLRSKMEKGDGLPKLIVTVHGEGYLFGATVTS